MNKNYYNIDEISQIIDEQSIQYVFGNPEFQN